MCRISRNHRHRRVHQRRARWARTRAAVNGLLREVRRTREAPCGLAIVVLTTAARLRAHRRAAHTPSNTARPFLERGAFGTRRDIYAVAGGFAGLPRRRGALMVGAEAPE